MMYTVDESDSGERDTVTMNTSQVVIGVECVLFKKYVCDDSRLERRSPKETHTHCRKTLTPAQAIEKVMNP
jgi:hypothetical protein